MKEKLNPGILLLVLTGLLFIAGIFLVELRTARQISDYEAQLDTFIQQVDAKKKNLITPVPLTLMRSSLRRIFSTGRNSRIPVHVRP